ncbi:MAG: hypothetical protein KGL39_18960 [Patescibacteria group bacterium]|nr:hypothetical protein [Patescibacteria group bacterium]
MTTYRKGRLIGEVPPGWKLERGEDISGGIGLSHPCGYFIALKCEGALSCVWAHHAQCGKKREVFTREVFRRPDYWYVFQWRISDRVQSTSLMFVPCGKSKKHTGHGRENSKWRKCGWFNGNMQPVKADQVKKFFRWWRQRNFNA